MPVDRFRRHAAPVLGGGALLTGLLYAHVTSFYRSPELNFLSIVATAVVTFPFAALHVRRMFRDPERLRGVRVTRVRVLGMGSAVSRSSACFSGSASRSAFPISTRAMPAHRP
jgi:hypothetical protein